MLVFKSDSIVVVNRRACVWVEDLLTCILIAELKKEKHLWECYECKQYHLWAANAYPVLKKLYILNIESK